MIVKDKSDRIISEMEKVVLGQRDFVKYVVIAFLA